MSGWVGQWAGGWTGGVESAVVVTPVELTPTFGDSGNLIAEMLMLMDDVRQQPREFDVMLTPLAIEARLIRKRGT